MVVLTVLEKLLVVLDRLWEIKSANAFGGDDEHRIEVRLSIPLCLLAIKRAPIVDGRSGRVVRRGKFGELRLVKFQEGFSCPTRATYWWG